MAGKKAFGTLLKRGDGQSPETFTSVPHCGDMEGPGIKKNFEDVTTHSSAALGGFMEWEPTLKDGESFKAPVNWDPADPIHQAIATDYASDVLRNWQVVFNTTPARTMAFAGYVAAFGPKAPVKGILVRELEIKITGPVVES